GVLKVVVEYKHMGSRAVVVVCRDEERAEERFGTKTLGSVYTRNGRPFLRDDRDLLRSIRDGLTRSNFWSRFRTDWGCLNGEFLPWKLKAERLMQEQHGELLLCGEAELAELDETLKELAPEQLPHVARRRECFSKYRALHEHYRGVGEEIR